MQMRFEECKKLFDGDKVEELTASKSGLLWLFIRSINRKELLENFFASNKIELTETKVNKQFEELYYLLLNDDEGIAKLRLFIKQNAKIYSAFEELQISSELYKMKYFAWGGDYTNALDKFLIDRYVKVHSSFEVITNKQKARKFLALKPF